MSEFRERRVNPYMALGQKKKRTKRLSSLAIFLLAFVLFVTVFGGLCLWAVVKINEQRRVGAGDSSSAPISTDPAATFTEEDARNLFLVTVDTDAQDFIVVRTDPANTRIRTLAIPRETTVDVGTSQTRMFELYASGGATATRDAAAKLLGMEFQNYAVLTYSNTEKLLKKLDGGLIFTLPEDLDYQNPSTGATLKLTGGSRNLTPSQVVDVMRYPNWHGGRKQQADIQAQLTAALINQYMKADRDMEADFNSLIGFLQTDIKVSHFVKAKAGLQYLAERNTGAICSSASLEGQYVGSGDALRFEPADSAKANLRGTFGTS